MQSRTKRYTLRDVAQRLGVSSATISNAFSRPDQLSAQLRDKILKECKEIGYSGPNAAARSLRTGKSGILGLFLADKLSFSFSDPVANQFVKGVTEQAEKMGSNVLLFSSQNEHNLNYSVEAVPDGFILYGAPERDQQLERILKQQKPLITVDFNLPGYDSVNIDNHAAAYASANHALAQSQGKVAILGQKLMSDAQSGQIREGDLFDPISSISRRRLEGYRQACDEQARDIAAIWHLPQSQPLEAEQVARRLLQQDNRPEVFLCMSDRIAIGVINAAIKSGLNVPQDVKVVGFDGIEEGEHLHPSLTTICQRSEEKGKHAVMRLLNQSGGDYELSSELVCRESC